ncbi:hypothetical protein IT6_02565 [Methylacidiphilum caldifontis]|uniref:hypothetical protein n=1 Tax=Methylacidiphilum caldifontis TaxID=2795386 RepID=UPI001A908FCB|nr:hypothetical protein [Methylacidiphilum caldifontis]QSR89187.1 hypothetical protein IT6_02565 [Methylacidiphilum caldifontis]
MKIRPVYHWRPDRVRNHIRLCFLAFWISARLGAEWVEKGFTEEVPKVLRRLQSIRLVQLYTKGKPVTWLLSRIPTALNPLLQKLDLLPLFDHP